MLTKIEKCFIFGIIFLAAFLIPIVLLLPPYVESKIFNKLTGGNTTTWDALWVELRVDCNNYSKEK